MKVYVFPGQGSQARGMGEGLFEKYADLVKVADEILGYSIQKLCLEDPQRELNKTQFTQPALYVVNALSYYDALAKTGKKPDFVAGHSLGEFNALLAAECFDFSTGLKLVQRRGELMSQATDGAMAAILNASKEEIERTLQDNNLNIDIANFNTYSQIVISGPIEEIGMAESYFQSGQIKYYPLNTSGAFHSRYMEPAKEKFASYLKSFEFANPRIPVISNVTAEPYKESAIIQNLSTQITSSVRWSDSILFLLKTAAAQGKEIAIESIGHGDTLTKIIAKIKIETQEIIDAIKVSPTPDITKVIADPAEASLQFDALNSEEKVSHWNKHYPIGTRVRSTLLNYDELETRTEATLLFGHRAAVYMKGYNGYFDLDELQLL